MSHVEEVVGATTTPLQVVGSHDAAAAMVGSLHISAAAAAGVKQDEQVSEKDVEKTKVGRCKPDPSLKAACFQNLNLIFHYIAFNLNLVF